MSTIPDNLKSQHLFVLVGGNPLPNYVAIRLLRRENGHIYLVHTAQTSKIADRICQGAGLVLGQDAVKVLVDDGNAAEMRAKVLRLAASKSGVGLNYTGGTKHMALHVFQGLIAANPRLTLSYLDAETLSMRIEQGDGATHSFAIGLAVQLRFQELLALHGRTASTIETDLICPEVYPDLPRVPYDRWREWWNSASRGMGGCTADIALPTEPAFAPLRPHWGDATTLGDLAAHWRTDVSTLAKWFGEAGLESYVLWSVRGVAEAAQLGETAKNVKPNEIDFEFDVVAMRGYQLFAISCANSKDKGTIKLKLMEAYVRARQMGGDEARVAVVCRAPANDPLSSPRRIEQEMMEQLGADGKIRVFGAEHIAQLQTHLLNWFTAK
ncbi:MAG: hypothetical protein ACK4SA_18385 [Caldilinea sp.]